MNFANRENIKHKYVAVSMLDLLFIILVMRSGGQGGQHKKEIEGK